MMCGAAVLLQLKEHQLSVLSLYSLLLDWIGFDGGGGSGWHPLLWHHTCVSLYTNAVDDVLYFGASQVLKGLVENEKEEEDDDDDSTKERKGRRRSHNPHTHHHLIVYSFLSLSDATRFRTLKLKSNWHFSHSAAQHRAQFPLTSTQSLYSCCCEENGICNCNATSRGQILSSFFVTTFFLLTVVHKE
jgi:hypothetical protein